MNYKDVNDYELLYMISDNSDEYVEMLLQKYRPLIKLKVKKWESIITKMGIDIEDFEQELYLATFTAIRNYTDDLGSSFYTYLMLVIDRKIKSILRICSSPKYKSLSLTVSLYSPIANGLTIADTITDGSDSVDTTLVEKELREEIYGFCYELGFFQGQILELILNNYSPCVIEKLLGLPDRKIYTILHTIRLSLKKYLIKNSGLMV